MANSLTSSGLTCGAGTMVHFVSTLSSSAVGIGMKTFSRPSSKQTSISSTIGAVSIFHNPNGSDGAILPSEGTYLVMDWYSGETSITLEIPKPAYAEDDDRMRIWVGGVRFASEYRSSVLHSLSEFLRNPTLKEVA